jgi:two-component system OmpR family sensor kinase
VHLVALAADSITAARARSADRTIELRVEQPSRALGVNGSDPDIGADAGIVGESVVIGDENRLRQALDNLLTNAVRHTPADTPITVRVRPADAGGHCLLEVADTGPGLSADDAAHVFERFYRSDPSRARTSTQQGSGLGLAIVAAIAQAHGGSATVRSRLGHGACFTLSLPAARIPGAPPGDLRRQLPRAGAQAD